MLTIKPSSLLPEVASTSLQATGVITSTEPPLWTDASSDRAVDLQAAKDMSLKLSENAAIGDRLRELARDRRAENRALAAQTLSLLGNWDWVTEPKVLCRTVATERFGRRFWMVRGKYWPRIRSTSKSWRAS